MFVDKILKIFNFKIVLNFKIIFQELNLYILHHFVIKNKKCSVLIVNFIYFFKKKKIKKKN